MYCNSCGNQIANNSTFCNICGQPQNGTGTRPTIQANITPPQIIYGNAPVQHNEPRCGSCGYIGQWKVEPILLVHHWVIFILLLFLYGAGIFYLITVLIIRGNKNRRAKICPYCKGRNMWTFIY